LDKHEAVTKESKSHPTYWVQVFTVKTWQEFLDAGGKTSGFRSTRWGLIQQIKPKDQLLCYLSGVGKFIGILEVRDEPYLDTTKIWEDEIFPCRVDVRVVIALRPSTAVPIRDLRDRLSIFRKKSWGVYLMASPSKWKEADAESIIDAVFRANTHKTD